MIYLFDLDGTVADASHRLHFIQEKPQDWNAFFLSAGEDKPIWEVISVIRALRDADHITVAVTGRSEISRQITADWLRKYRVPHAGIFMRKADDHRQDNIVKSELLDKVLTQFTNISVGGAFEDRQQVVDMYRARGVRVFQVDKGDF